MPGPLPYHQPCARWLEKDMGGCCVMEETTREQLTFCCWTCPIPPFHVYLPHQVCLLLQFVSFSPPQTYCPDPTHEKKRKKGKRIPNLARYSITTNSFRLDRRVVDSRSGGRWNLGQTYLTLYPQIYSPHTTLWVGGLRPSRKRRRKRGRGTAWRKILQAVF